MSRTGKMPVKIPSGVKLNLSGDLLKVEGKNGKLEFTIPKAVKLDITPEQATVSPVEGEDNARALYGTIRSVVANMVHGVSTGFTKELEINGVGYRASVKGQVLNLNLGFSHPIDYKLPQGISAVAKGNKITLSGADKVILGRVAAEVRGFRPPEPYKGKGVKYADERIIRKEGKSAGSK